MISARRMELGVEVMGNSGLDEGVYTDVMVDKSDGAGLMVGTGISAWVEAGGVGKASQAAIKGPPATAPSPTAIKRRNSLRLR
jgi:hypothetical protein